MFKTIFNSTERLKIWYRKNSNYRYSRRLSDSRAASLAEKLILSGSLHRGRLTGAPLDRVAP